jgi:MFS transporter, OFA family, oxalate/formate antiporter
VASSVVSYFSPMSGIASLTFGVLQRAVTTRWKLELTGLMLCLDAGLYGPVPDAAAGYLRATFFGFGMGGLLTMLPVAWADYFGPLSYGAIRGIAQIVQALARASGPWLSGLVRDITGIYETALACFALLSVASVSAAVLAKPFAASTEMHQFTRF